MKVPQCLSAFLYEYLHILRLCHLLPLCVFLLRQSTTDTYRLLISILLACNSTPRLFHYIAVVELITPSTSMFMYYHHLHYPAARESMHSLNGGNIKYSRSDDKLM